MAQGSHRGHDHIFITQICRQWWGRIYPPVCFSRAQESGLDLQSATDYARKIAEQNAQQQFQASEAQKGREFQRSMNAKKNLYGDMNAGLENEFGGGNDYGGALARVLLGTGVSLGTNYLMTKNLMNKQGGQGTSGGNMFSQLSPYTQGASGRAPTAFSGNLDYSGFSRPGFSNIRG